MINICFVISRAKNQGPCNVIKNLVMNSLGGDFKFFLVTLYQGDDAQTIESFKKLGVSVEQLNFKNRLNCYINGKKLIENFCNLNKIDILHSNTFLSDLICSKVKNVIKISTIHNRPFEDYRFLYGNFLGQIIAKMHIKKLKKMDCCVCCSKSVEQSIKKYISRTCVVKNGISPVSSFKNINRSSLNIEENAKVFIFVGSVSKRKNVLALVDSFSKARDDSDYLLILGSGDCIDECKKKQDSHIQFLGFINDPSPYYSISDFYISASLSEGLSMSQLESLAFGLKQFVSNIASHKEILEVSSTLGLTFTSENFEENFKKIKACYSLDEKNKIKNIFNEYFSAKIMARNYAIIYKSLKEQNGSRKEE